MTKAVIFDMDGVLVDNRDVHIEAFIIFCKRYGITYTAQDLGWMFGMGNDEIMPRVLPAEIVERRGIQELGNEKEAVYREIYASAVKPVDGLLELLGALRQAGIKTAVGSSANIDNIRFVIEKCGLDGMFDTIVHGGMVTRCKPDPEIFLKAARTLDTPPGECLIFEDSKAGITAANRAGIPVIALETTHTARELEDYPKQRIIKDFTEISLEDILL